jgi:uncharacterized membrane protein YGL010W
MPKDGAYHNNKVNKAIHFIFVPTILWSALILLANVELPFPFADASYLVAFGYGAYYISLEPIAGVRKENERGRVIEAEKLTF